MFKFCPTSTLECNKITLVLHLGRLLYLHRGSSCDCIIHSTNHFFFKKHPRTKGNFVTHSKYALTNHCRISDTLVVKVADFGLSRDVKETDIYKMKETTKLPVKWMAIECLDRKIYTTASDVVSTPSLHSLLKMLLQSLYFRACTK